MSEKDIFDRIMSAPFLRRFYGVYTRNKAVLLYVFFGGLTTIISIGSFVLFDWVLNELLANVISWIFAVTFAYITNRIWVFRSRVHGKAIWKEVSLFFSGRLFTLGLEEVILLVFVTWMQCNGALIKTIAQFVVLVTNYIISKWITFRRGEAA